MTYVTVYEITRHYGGPEEGGWYYNWYHPVHSELFQSFARTTVLRDRWTEKNRGDIYSVLGGVEYAVYEEELPYEMASKERPHYE